MRLCQKFGVTYFRAQIFKPRTSPYSFQGHGESGLTIIDFLREQGLKLVSEACSLEQLKVVETYADVIQVGARNMQNFEYLKQIGRSAIFQRRLPYVMLKRGFSNNYKEWIGSAKYLEESGVPEDKIILCERGTRDGVAFTGTTLDFAMAYKAKYETPYQVIIDPSHGTGARDLVLPMAKLSLGLSFDGMMIEVHPEPEKSVSDAKQALSVPEIEQFLLDHISNLGLRQEVGGIYAN